MTKSVFTKEQGEVLITNKFVTKITYSSTKFTDEFKEIYLEERKRGKDAIKIYSKFG